MNTITLYSLALSPFALKVQSYLLYLGVDFHTEFLDPLKFRESLPCGNTVPVLAIDDDVRNESSRLARWLNDLFPEKNLFPEEFKECVVDADEWVTHKLINLFFRDLIGFDESFFQRNKKRWALSKVLDKTSPNGVTFRFRVVHLLLIGRSFIHDHILQTDTTRHISELRLELAKEFELRLQGGPFLCGSPYPTLADLSAYPQITRSKIVDGQDYLLPGKAVAEWVRRMETCSPSLRDCFPDQIKHVA